jgi:hypothetical protein
MKLHLVIGKTISAKAINKTGEYPIVILKSISRVRDQILLSTSPHIDLGGFEVRYETSQCKYQIQTLKMLKRITLDESAESRAQVTGLLGSAGEPSEKTRLDLLINTERIFRKSRDIAGCKTN